MPTFQSTRPRGARRRPAECDAPAEPVSIHAPARGATAFKRGLNACFLFQSTRPRGARQIFAAFYGLTYDVSIHAPARGATETVKASRFFDRVSIHAPARGATIPRPFHVWNAPVSIHAPARGATTPAFPLSKRTLSFNPRAREGRDASCRSQNRHRLCFNPRAREGRDRPNHISGV